MVAQNIFFGIISAVVVISAVRMVTTRNIVHAALYLVAVLAGLGAL
ncbi:MAG TPA: NADH-quinone oxidoreductase subunit J, partial [Acidimicrobiaceae bacterium]|nr:NADH-quinone oxidoreductase subunit J [Acidimicrobiaceae bacterium]